MSMTVYAIAANVTHAKSLVSMATKGGFRASDISALYHQAPEAGLVPAMPAGTIPSAGSSLIPAPASSARPSPDDGPAGILGGLQGIGILALPGVRPLVASGPLKASLTAVGATGLAGGLVGLGIPEQESKRYEACVLKGGVLIAVQADDQEWMEKCKTMLKSSGAKEISGTGFATPAIAARA